MDKRRFLSSAALAGALPLMATAAPPARRGPALLTITGDIAKPNRPPMDPVRDQMMHKQKLTF